MKIKHVEDYKKLRQKSYPDLSELADALYWKNKGDSTKFDEYMGKIDEVKNKYPKAP